MQEVCVLGGRGVNDDRVTPQRFFSVFAIGEAITWALLLIGMFLKYVTKTTEVMVSIGGGVHGFMFIAFCFATVFVGVSQRWGAGKILLGLASAIPPFVTIPFEIWCVRRGLLSGGWGLGPEGREPRGFVERVFAWAITRPVLTLVLGLVIVAVIFTAMLLAGPPV